MTMACFLEKIASFLENMPIGTGRRRGEDKYYHGTLSKRIPSHAFCLLVYRRRLEVEEQSSSYLLGGSLFAQEK